MHQGFFDKFLRIRYTQLTLIHEREGAYKLVVFYNSRVDNTFNKFLSHLTYYCFTDTRRYF